MPDDHSASRHVDVLEAEAPHLIAHPGEAAARTQRGAGTLRLAIATARREHRETGDVREELWILMDWLAHELGEALGALEIERRQDGSR